MIQLHRIRFEEKGTKVIYDYSWSHSVSKYFQENNRLYISYHNTDVSEVPYSLLVIPFLANILPISWFIGFDVQVDQVDSNFCNAISQVKQVFIENHTTIEPGKSSLHYQSLVDNKVMTGRPALLFSEGVDSTAAFLRHQAENPHLVTIHGADIRINDQVQINTLKNSILRSPLLADYQKHIVRSNVREFYTHRLNLLFSDLDWWGRIQHGLSLVSLLTPLSYVHHIPRVYIASTATEQSSMFWGSMPAIDNKLKWANVSVIHDGYELDRGGKVSLIVHHAQSTGTYPQLRVCFSNRHSALNCSHCDKCHRTILLIILSGGDPNRFGFNVSPDIYDEVMNRISKGYYNDMMQYLWSMVANKIASSPAPFIFVNEHEEKMKLARLRETLMTHVGKPFLPVTWFKKMRYLMQLKHPALLQLAVRLYRKLAGQR